MIDLLNYKGNVSLYSVIDIILITFNKFSNKSWTVICPKFFNPKEFNSHYNVFSLFNSNYPTMFNALVTYS